MATASNEPSTHAHQNASRRWLFVVVAAVVGLAVGIGVGAVAFGDGDSDAAGLSQAEHDLRAACALLDGVPDEDPRQLFPRLTDFEDPVRPRIQGAAFAAEAAHLAEDQRVGQEGMEMAKSIANQDADLFQQSREALAATCADIDN